MTNYDGALPSGYVLRLSVTEDTLNAGANTSRAVGSLSIIKGTGSGKWTGYGVSWAIDLGGNTASGSLSGYDFRSYSLLTLWSGAFTITHSPDGSKTISVSGSFTETDPAPELGNKSVSGTFGMTTLTQAPAVPSSVTCTYVSDTSMTVAWSDTSATNGLPTTDQIQLSTNGGAYSGSTSIAASTSVNMTVAANQKVLAKVQATNATGSSGYSSASNAIFTTPAAPTSAVATKSGSDIVVTWTNNVGFSEYGTEVWHGTITGGVTTWDGSALTTASTGVATYTHVAPSTSYVHVYQLRAKNTDTGALTSSYVTSNSVQLLTAPNAPTFGSTPTYTNKAASLIVPWTHNPVDTTPQKYYEFSYSTNGGGSWTSTGKVTSTTNSYTISASTYAANVVLSMRVRTWGDATTGGPNGNGSSDWSSTRTVTFKTIPVATITTPANASTYTHAALTVVLGFSQAESATFVQATIGLYNGATLLEQVNSTTLAGTTFATRVADGGSYTVKATETDSNGLVTAQVTSSFTVAYTVPVTPGVTVTYLDSSGIGQLDLTIPAAGVGTADAVAVTILRTIGGVTETVIEAYPAAPTLTILDMTPTINGTNTYTVITISADGATTEVDTNLSPTEPNWAFVNTGTGFASEMNFFLKPPLASNPSRSSTLIRTSGREEPIALFGVNTNLEVSGVGEVQVGQGSTVAEIESFLKSAGMCCYRDASGRRIFGLLSGSISNQTPWLADFNFKITAAS